MISSLLLAAAMIGQTPDWREAKMPVPRGWSDADLSRFEETAHGDPVFILRQYYGVSAGGTHRGLFVPRHTWSHMYPVQPRVRYYRYYR